MNKLNKTDDKNNLIIETKISPQISPQYRTTNKQALF